MLIMSSGTWFLLFLVSLSGEYSSIIFIPVAWTKMTIVSVLTREYDATVNRILRILKRRNLGRGSILGVPNRPEDLPEAEPMLPGHTLIRPSLGMLKSAVKFPRHFQGNLVYGNLDNLGITYGKFGERLMYTGFRRANEILDSSIRQAIQNIYRNNGYKRNDKVLLLEFGSSDEKSSMATETVSEEEKNARDIPNEFWSGESRNLRRTKTTETGAEKSSELFDSKESESELSDDNELDYERNPGNPYTVHFDKYKQNYMWNHLMDGDHMNINPHAPFMNLPGPSGGDFFFQRKWWYFNQDDYKPLR